MKILWDGFKRIIGPIKMRETFCIRFLFPKNFYTFSLKKTKVDLLLGENNKYKIKMTRIVIFFKPKNKFKKYF